jgi:hypothetical protein
MLAGFNYHFNNKKAISDCLVSNWPVSIRVLKAIWESVECEADMLNL